MKLNFKKIAEPNIAVITDMSDEVIAVIDFQECEADLDKRYLNGLIKINCLKVSYDDVIEVFQDILSSLDEERSCACCYECEV